jgi:tRNA acetyltransferase TAN1
VTGNVELDDVANTGDLESGVESRLLRLVKKKKHPFGEDLHGKLIRLDFLVNVWIQTVGGIPDYFASLGTNEAGYCVRPIHFPHHLEEPRHRLYPPTLVVSRHLDHFVATVQNTITTVCADLQIESSQAWTLGGIYYFAAREHFSGRGSILEQIIGMPKEFNILATTERVNESRACSELWMLLKAAGDENPWVDRIGIWGLVVANTKLNPITAIAKMRENWIKKPEAIQALYRVIPLQCLVPTTKEDIVKATQKLSTTINAEDSYRITIEKRRTQLASKDIIDAVAEGINRRVDLENPDWLILIEITGRITGVSVVPPISILNVQKERVRLMAEAKKGTAFNDKAG